MTTHEGDPADLAGRRWLFGPAILDERSLELTVGGQHVPLERKPLEVLLYLLHHAGEVVTKDDIAESLWTGRILTETVLARCISVLRQGLKDDDKTLIRTVHGYGYRLVADVRIEASTAGAPPALDFKVGDHPPLRPQWKLVERLGTGGHGEAWLARHEKTGDARVFKFALDAGALTALKREITLYRLLHDTLGARAAIARIFEWNLTEPTYFIEMEHVPGGNLHAWSESQGGLACVPLSLRLELAAQVADALAAAHSVGALHKDLKPANVLVEVGSGSPVVRLCDFGSGSVLDPQRLEALGITRLGFTGTVTNANAAGTPLYLAPEVVAGQPFTVQADVYALGVLLYQFVTGDLRKPLAPGWEADVADALLREDIGAAAAGNPARRLTDAAQVADRLRTLEARREARAAEAAARQRAELARRTLAELKRTRVYATLLLALTAVAIAGGVMAHRARNAAVAATATAEAVSGFLMDDVFRMDSGLIRPSEVSYETLLTRAAARVDARLKGQPAAAANIHWSLGRRYQDIGEFDFATKEYEQALALFVDLYGEGAERSLMAMDRLAWAYVEDGQLPKGIAAARKLQDISQSHLSGDELATLAVQARVARTLTLAGKYPEAEKELRLVIQGAATDLPATRIAEALLEEWFGIVSSPSTTSVTGQLSAYAKSALAGSILEEFGDDYAEAETLLRDSIEVFSSNPKSEDLLAVSHVYLAAVLAARGNYAQAGASVEHVKEFFDHKFPAKHYGRALASMVEGRAHLEQQRHSDAVRLFQEAVDLCKPKSGCPARARAVLLWDLGRALIAANNTKAAIDVLTEALSLQTTHSDPAHPMTVRIQVELANAMRARGDIRAASEILSGISRDLLAELRPHRQTRADLVRIQGLLLLDEGNIDGAILKLREAFEIVSHRLGPKHWRTDEARAELQTAIRRQHPAD